MKFITRFVTVVALFFVASGARADRLKLTVHACEWEECIAELAMDYIEKRIPGYTELEPDEDTVSWNYFSKMARIDLVSPYSDTVYQMKLRVNYSSSRRGYNVALFKSSEVKFFEKGKSGLIHHRPYKAGKLPKPQGGERRIGALYK